MHRKPPVAWSWLLALAGAKLALQLLSSGPLAYGLMTDELYYLDCAGRLDWGYVDHPPLSIALLRASIGLFGTGLLGVRAVAIAASLATLILTALLARELGGGPIAQAIAAGAALASPVHLSFGSFFSMNPIEMALWALAFLLVARIANGGHGRLWLGVGVVVGLGLLNKWSMSWLAGGLFVGLLLTPERRWLATPWPWAGAAVALLLAAPNLIWQATNGWPTVEFLRNTATQKQIVASAPLQFLAAQLFVAGLPLWPFGLWRLLRSPELARHRALGWAFAAVLAFLALSGSAKLYYAAPALSICFAAAGAAIERARWRGAAATTGCALAITGSIAAPYAIPLLAPEQLVALQRRLGVASVGVASVGVDAGDASPLHQGFAQMFHGRAVTDAVVRAYDALSPERRQRVGILTHQFGESGALNFYGPAHGLPRALGTQGSYWLWGTEGADGEWMLEVTADEQDLSNRYRQCERVARIECAYCLPRFTRKAVHFCSEPRRPLAEVWPELKRYR